MYATEENHWWHIAKRRIVEEYIKNLVKDKKQVKILDVGCGTGKNMELLSHYGTVYGVDISAKALSYCKKRGLTNLKKADITKLPFQNNFFDIIIALDILEHVDDHKAVKELQRVTKKDGTIILTVPAYQWLWSQWDEVLYHKRRYTTQAVRNLFSSRTYTVKHSTYLYSFLVLPAFVIRIIKSRFSKKTYTSDFQITNAVLNNFFLFLTQIERTIIRFAAIPFGTSIFCVIQNEKK